MVIRNQVVVFRDRIIDVNYNAINSVLDIYKIENKKKVFSQLVRLFHYFLKETPQ